MKFEDDNMLCTTAAIQIKGTAQWLYNVNMEY